MKNPFKKQDKFSTGFGGTAQTGSGEIKLVTLQDGNKFITTATYQFNNVNTEGAIDQLEKLVSKLKEDLRKEPKFEIPTNTSTT